MATKSTWHVRARVEKNGQYAEYDDHAEIVSPGPVPSAKDVHAAQVAQIIAQNPHLRGGRITGTATRIN
ncbi:hypothetical protein CIB93_28295 [Streptomyces sp. WZ.A104]|uniref:hypothetical protein n=1 Tax=Streptomyces sp. WZ.A104 TaxID=2023771 RepID=UPI000BBC9A2A|nr:hypothetical protein [Streptomyces sp. WZ.A104]PCG82732.1 hypothetical protein CIB93_28295 [Streptomyces sp. WZ.A104]